MEERELAAIIENEVAASIGGVGGGTTSGMSSSELATERAMELDYYNSKPLGNEREGESQVVSSDVFDAVEGMLPHLIKTFTASDDAVVFEPEGQEDEAAAAQRTDLCNYVFYRQNNGFVLMYEWFKDALLQKNGVVKYWWDDSVTETEEQYAGLTEGQYLTLKQEEGVEILDQSSYDDPDAVKQKQAMIEKIGAMPPQMGANPQMMLAQIEAAPLPQLYDCKVKITKAANQVRIKAIAPEEFGISSKHNCISIQDAPFVHHRSKMTISALRQMGCPEEVIDEIGADDGSDNKPETLARNRFVDEDTNGLESDDSLREVYVTDCYIRLDFDEDGIAELRHVIKPGSAIWINEKCSHIPFAAITPIIMPHRFIGKSIAEIVMDVQFVSSVLWRQMLNNLYLTNNPQKVVLGSAGGVIQADLDRLMTSRVGGILVEYTPNAIRNQEVPFVAGSSFPMMEYLQTVKENRTGNTRYNQGTDADSLNKTARGIQMIQNAAQQKLDLIARIFAETGVKDLFRGIAYFLSKYSTKAMTVRLRNQWVDVDPRQWKTQFDMTVNVGLGTGNKDAQLVHLRAMAESHKILMEMGRGYMVTDQNVYNLHRKMAENMGFKHPDMFVTDPQQPQAQQAKQQQQQQPNPEILKLQQADAEAKLKTASQEKQKMMDLQVTKAIEDIKAQAQITIAQMEIASKERIAQMQIAADAQIEVFKAQQSLQGEAAELDKKKQAINYEENLLTLKKNIDAIVNQEAGEKQTAIAQQAAQEATGPFNGAIEQLAGQLQQTAQQLAQQQAKIADNVVQLEKKANEKKPRRYDIKKKADGYEITAN